MGEAGPGSAQQKKKKKKSPIRIFPTQSCWAKLYAWNHLVVNSMAYLSHMRQLRCWGRARCWEGESRKQLGMPQESSLKTGRQLVPCLWAISCGKGLGGGGGTVGFDILLRRCITGNDHLWMEEEAGLATWQLLPQYHFFLSTSNCFFFTQSLQLYFNSDFE